MNIEKFGYDEKFYIFEMSFTFLLILKMLETMKAHIQSNLKVPHPTLVALGISAALTSITVGIFYIVDIGEIFGIEDAEAAKRGGRPSCSSGKC
jgi:hypothetical protein